MSAYAYPWVRDPWKRDPVYETLAVKYRLPWETAPPAPVLAWSVKRLIEYTLAGMKLARKAPAGFGTVRLVWVGEMESARGKAVGGRYVGIPGHQPMILLASALKSPAFLFQAALHELAHAFGEEDEARCDGFADWMLPKALKMVNDELEALPEPRHRITQLAEPEGRGVSWTPRYEWVNR